MILKTANNNVLRFVEIAQVDNDRRLEPPRYAPKVEAAKFRPLRHQHHCIGFVGGLVGAVAIVGIDVNVIVASAGIIPSEVQEGRTAEAFVEFTGYESRRDASERERATLEPGEESGWGRMRPVHALRWQAMVYGAQQGAHSRQSQQAGGATPPIRGLAV